jgi:DNA-binding MarR family transcriptional regulator
MLSTPNDTRLRNWRVFFETAFALIDILDDDLQAARGLTLRWYDVLVHLDEAPDGLRMNELAASILSSNSGLTRVVDRMDEAGLVRRERPADDRRVIKVLLTDKGREELRAAREVHHRSIQEHFLEHLSDRELAAIGGALENVRGHVRPLRPGRITDVPAVNGATRRP